MRYRADIDGIRAIAILPVVFYHAGFEWMRGGYVGVDVFFVISGYLITSILRDDFAADRFSIAGFYERRARRLLPSLFAVLLLTMIGAHAILMPPELKAFGKSVIATVFFASNFVFWNEAGYFDSEAEFKPLLHTWSLAVEEQFYIVFPLVLAALWRWAPRRLPIAVGALLIASFVLSNWLVSQHPDAAFYLAPSRFWEIMCGALLAIVRPQPLRNPVVREGLAGAGLLMIAAAVFSYGPTTFYPGAGALLPCVGTVLLIYCTASGGFVSRLLSRRPLVLTGLVSYALYLWHWPIIALVENHQAHEIEPLQGWLVFALSYALALATWHYVERPFRERRWLADRRPLFWCAGAGGALAALAGAVFIATEGFPNRLPPAAEAIYEARKDDGNRWDDCAVDLEGKPGPSLADVRAGKLCGVGVDNGSAPHFVIWGDSHARAMAPALDESATALGMRGLLLSAVACPPTIGFHGLGEKPARVARCKETHAAALDLLDTGKISVVFLVARWPKYVLGGEFGEEGPFFDPSIPYRVNDLSREVRSALGETLKELAKRRIRAVLVVDVPEIGYDVPYTLAKAAWQGTFVDVTPSRAVVQERQAKAKAIFEELARKYGAEIVDPTPALCDAMECRVERDGRLLYIDEDHLSEYGARSIAYLFAASLGAGR